MPWNFDDFDDAIRIPIDLESTLYGRHLKIYHSIQKQL